MNTNVPLKVITFSFIICKLYLKEAVKIIFKGIHMGEICVCLKFMVMIQLRKYGCNSQENERVVFGLRFLRWWAGEKSRKLTDG